MSKRWNILVLALFSWALIAAPFVHRVAGHHACESCSACAHGAHEGHCPGNEPPAKHDADHCSICQLAATPALAAAPMVCLAPDSTPVALPECSFLAPTVPAACRLPFSCGPPA